jgi:hypothetical protein
MSEAYWLGWPKKCPYIDDLNYARAMGEKYLTQMVPILKKSGKTGIVVFDIDDTLVMGDPEKVLGVEDMRIGDLFVLPPNQPIRQLAITARKLGYKILALTARPLESKESSQINLDMMGIPYDGIIMNDKEEDPFFKIHIRRKLEKPDRTVVLTVGDQLCDGFLPGKSAVIKLPDETSKCTYVYIP